MREIIFEKHKFQKPCDDDWFVYLFISLFYSLHFNLFLSNNYLHFSLNFDIS